MNWLTKLMGMLPLIPYVVAGIEQIHGNAIAGTDKKTLAMQALGLAGGTAETVLPGDAPAIEAATALVSGAIDGVVATFNAAGLFVKKTGAAPATSSGPAPAPASSATKASPLETAIAAVPQPAALRSSFVSRQLAKPAAVDAMQHRRAGD